jgi:hypothetical protein
LNRKIKDRPTEDEGGGGHVAYSPGLVGRACGYVEGDGEGKRKAAVQVAEERCRRGTEGVPTSYLLTWLRGRGADGHGRRRGYALPSCTVLPDCIVFQNKKSLQTSNGRRREEVWHLA